MRRIVVTLGAFVPFEDKQTAVEIALKIAAVADAQCGLSVGVRSAIEISADQSGFVDGPERWVVTKE